MGPCTGRSRHRLGSVKKALCEERVLVVVCNGSQVYVVCSAVHLSIVPVLARFNVLKLVLKCVLCVCKE